jgi:hypothetical protein
MSAAAGGEGAGAGMGGFYHRGFFGNGVPALRIRRCHSCFRNALAEGEHPPRSHTQKHGVFRVFSVISVRSVVKQKQFLRGYSHLCPPGKPPGCGMTPGKPGWFSRK